MYGIRESSYSEASVRQGPVDFCAQARIICLFFFLMEKSYGTVFSADFYGGGGGVCVMKAGQTPYGVPTKTISLGQTAVPQSVFHEFLSALSTSQFKPTSYNLLKNNCNHFSNEVSNFLCGVDIPEDILNLPEQVLRGNLGQDRPRQKKVAVTLCAFYEEPCWLSGGGGGGEKKSLLVRS